MKYRKFYSCVNVILVFVLYGCCNTHTDRGHFNMSSCRFEDLTKNKQNIDNLVRDTAKSFGFKESDKFSKSMVVFLRSKNDAVPDKFKTYTGIDALLSIGFDKGNQSLALRDFSNGSETEFFIAIENEISIRLNNAIGNCEFEFGN